MFLKKYIAGLGLVLLAGAGWRFCDSGDATQLFKPAPARPAIKFDNDEPTGAGLAGVAQDAQPAQPDSKGPTGIRKCKVGGSVIYTDAPCPKSGAEQAMGGGSVTVVKGQRPAVDVAAKAGSAPNVLRDLAGQRNPNEPSMLDKHIDRQVNN